MANYDKPDSSGSAGATNQPDADLQAQISQLREDLTSLADSVSQEASQQINRAQVKAAEEVSKLEDQIKDSPLKATAMAAGIGFLLGAILAR